jgi:heme oxygenase
MFTDYDDGTRDRNSEHLTGGSGELKSNMSQHENLYTCTVQVSKNTSAMFKFEELPQKNFFSKLYRAKIEATGIHSAETVDSLNKNPKWWPFLVKIG